MDMTGVERIVGKLYLSLIEQNELNKQLRNLLDEIAAKEAPVDSEATASDG